jgi:hypothetical protein
MKGDFTRFSDEKKYDGVLMQQGRLLLDNDWNLQQRINAYLRQSQTKDLVGRQGAPRSSNASDLQNFKLEPTRDPYQDLLIAPGHIYVDGILCELKSSPVAFKCSDKNGSILTVLVAAAPGMDGQSWTRGQWVEILSTTQDVGTIVHPSIPCLGRIDEDPTPSNETLLSLKIELRSEDSPITLPQDPFFGELRLVPTFLHQPHYSPRPPAPPEAGNNIAYLAYLDVWQRHVTAIEDPTILEPALNGPDTTTRTQTIWQVKLSQISNSPDENEIRQVIQPQPMGMLTAAVEGNGLSSATGLDNLLYRVEIYQCGALGTATLKWSRENGSVVSKIHSIQENKITISNANLDSERSFQGDEWVEVSDDVRDLQGQPGSLVKLTKVMGNVLFFDPSTLDGDPITPGNYPPNQKPKVRRWDHSSQKAAIKTEVFEGEVYQQKSQLIDLENGLTVQLHASTKAEFKTGDYWLIPFRASASKPADRIEWPYQKIGDGDKRIPIPQPPQGIHHHLAPLATVNLASDGTFSVSKDLRDSFPSLINCLEQSDLTTPEELEVTGGLYVTGQDTGSDFDYVPARVGVGTKEPQARVHVQGMKVKAIGQLSANKSEITAIKVAPRELLAAFKKGNKIEVDGTSVTITNVDGHKIAVDPPLTASAKGTITLTYQYPLLQLNNEAGDPQFIVTSQGQVGIGTAELHEDTTLGISDRVAIGSTAFIKDQPVPEKGLLVEGQVGIGTAELQQDTTLGISDRVAIGSPEFVKNHEAPESGVLVQKTLQAGALAIAKADDFSIIGIIQPQDSQFVFQAENTINFAFLGGDVSIGSQTDLNRQLAVHGTTVLHESVSIGSETVAPLNGLYVEGGLCIKKISDAGEKYALQIDPNVTDDANVLKINGKTIKQVVEENPSRTLKKEIKPLTPEDARELLQNLVPVQFKFKDDPTKKLRVGFIAEDVPKIFATADRKAINPNDIIATLTKVIQAQQECLARLTEAIKEQQNDITALKQIVYEHQE